MLNYVTKAVLHLCLGQGARRGRNRRSNFDCQGPLCALRDHGAKHLRRGSGRSPLVRGRLACARQSGHCERTRTVVCAAPPHFYSGARRDRFSASIKVPRLGKERSSDGSCGSLIFAQRRTKLKFFCKKIKQLPTLRRSRQTWTQLRIGTNAST